MTFQKPKTLYLAVLACFSITAMIDHYRQRDQVLVFQLTPEPKSTGMASIMASSYETTSYNPNEPLYEKDPDHPVLHCD